ncbi:cytochrome P450 2U1 [Trichonephila clavata]|uniref:Cytochrome P450 2U1 n=1 Tax=Trichonephila clavata TaxID=2740835 RepID=A0A8X6JH43_TRICU|nr:cytochrome P450 2U1 [Trichonephila clavata]
MFEELSTILSEVEVIVNHRPLTYVENDPGEPEPLTPAPFLELSYGDSKYPIHFIELIDATTARESHNKRKTYRTLLLKQLWRRWKEHVYLGQKYTIVLNEYKVAKEVLCNSAALDRSPDIFSHLGDIGFIAENGERWVEQRRYCLSATRDLGLGRGHWEDLIMDEASSFMKYLGGLKGKPTDISHNLATSITSNIISLLIGRRLKRDEEAEKIQLSTDYSDIALTYTGPSLATTAIPGLRMFCEKLKIAGYDKAFEIIQKFSSFIREEINLHKTSQDFRNVQDFINLYLQKISDLTNNEDVKHSFSEAMLEGNLAILFLGASDTIFSSLGWLYRLMSKHKDIQEKIYAELMEFIGQDGRARYEERHRIPYTFAVLMEAQRFGTIAPLSGTRKTNQDIHINGYIIPKGSEITANLWALHHDPAYWNQPKEFRPERFLTDGDTKIAKNLPSFAPFSFGRRNCPGETIAWMELLFYFSETLKRFEISPPPQKETEFTTEIGLVTRLSPQPLCFKERKH